MPNNSLIEHSEEAVRLDNAFFWDHAYLENRNCIIENLQYGNHINGNILLTAPEGVGKSAFIKALIEEHPTEHGDVSATIWGIAASFSVNGLGDFYTKMLRQLEDGNPEEGTPARKKQRVLKLIKHSGVKVVFIDEAHSIITKVGINHKNKYLQTLKELANERVCLWVLVGTNDARQIVTFDSEVSDRFPIRLRLDLLKFTTEAKCLEYAEFLMYLLQLIPRKVPFFDCLTSSLNEDGALELVFDKPDRYENLLRLLLAIDGKPRDLKRLLVNFLRKTDSKKVLNKEQMKAACSRAFKGQEQKLEAFSLPFAKVLERLRKRGLYV